MLFSSYFFLYFFLPAFFILYFSFREIKYKNFFIMLFSSVFFIWGDPLFYLIALCSMIFEYFVLHQYNKGKIIKKKYVIFLLIVINILLLSYFKYGTFLISLINDIFNYQFLYASSYLPLGISFVIFQKISFIIDFYDKKVKFPKKFRYYYIYIFYFPQVIAGPIIRYKEISSQFLLRLHSTKLFYSGLTIIIFGLFKKIVLADNLALIADFVFDSPVQLPFYYYLIGTIGFSLQLYFDFSGYSDIAIGIGRCCGFDIPRNFNLPYQAKSVTEFWRRWHMSLTRWMRDYLYIRLGGNRQGKYRTYFNLWFVFFLSGLWHGAAYNFLLWGAYHGFFLTFEKIFNKLIFGRFITLVIVFHSWVIFKSESISEFLSYIKNMYDFSFHSSQIPFFIDFNPLRIFLLVGCIYFVHIRNNTNFVNNLYAIETIDQYKTYKLIFVLILSLFVTITIFNNTASPFLYFRF